jgi:hypothetical protein
VRQRAQGRLLVLGIVFICLYSVIAIRVGTHLGDQFGNPFALR